MRSPEEISKTLIGELTTEKLEKVEKYIGRSGFKSLLSSLDIKIKWSSSLPFFKVDLEAELAKGLKKDGENLELTINKFNKLFTVLGPLPTKPVIVIGTVQPFVAKQSLLSFRTAEFIGSFASIVSIASSLSSALDYFSTLLSPPNNSFKCISPLADEANKLMSWKESDPLQPELQALLDFLVSISKEKQQAHVVLATSEYFLASWLSQGRLVTFIA